MFKIIEALKRSFDLYAPSGETDEYGAPDGIYVFMRVISAVLSLSREYREGEVAATAGEYKAVTSDFGVRRGMRLSCGERIFEVDYVNDSGRECILSLLEIYPAAGGDCHTA